VLRAILLVCALLVLLPLAAGCSSPAAAPPAQAASTSTSATSTTVPATVLPAVTAPAAGLTPTASSPLTTTLPVTATASVTSTLVVGTPAPRPTPSGQPPSDPKQLLNVSEVVPIGNIVAKRDFMPLDGGPVDNALVTLTSDRFDISLPITQDSSSGIVVLTYDPVYREWAPTWASEPISGTARPLPAANQPGGTNGGDLLRDGSHILEIRTTTVDGKAHLELFRYDSKTHKATLLKMVPQAGAPEKDAIFDADLDVTVADLDDDGVYEVVADNVAGVNTWRWDGSKFIPREAH